MAHSGMPLPAGFKNWREVRLHGIKHILIGVGDAGTTSIDIARRMCVSVKEIHSLLQEYCVLKNGRWFWPEELTKCQGSLSEDKK